MPPPESSIIIHSAPVSILLGPRVCLHTCGQTRLLAAVFEWQYFSKFGRGRPLRPCTMSSVRWRWAEVSVVAGQSLRQHDVGGVQATPEQRQARLQVVGQWALARPAEKAAAQ